MAFAVVIHEKGGQPRRQEFYKSEVTVGRVQGNDIVLPKQNVSKRHSRVVLKNGKFVITDLKSTNGTYVNGRKISSPSVIKETDKIYIGDFVLSTELIDGADEGASAAGAGAPPPPPPRTPPFASGSMPAQTIASNMSPFAAPAQEGGGEDYAQTAGALPVSSGSESPFSPATSVAPEPPQMSPPSPPSPPTPPAPSQAPAVSAPLAPIPPVAAPTPPVAAPTPPVAAPTPPVAAPIPPVAAPTPPVAAPIPPAAAPAVASAALLPPVSAPAAAPASSPAALDMSVFDGVESTGLVALHSALLSGLSQRSIVLPSRYRPGQQLNPELLGAVSEIISAAAQGQSDDEINQVMDEALSVGRIHNLIDDPQAQSIFLNGAYELVCHRADGKVSVTHNPFSSLQQARLAATRIMHGMGVTEGAGLLCAEGSLGEWRAYVDLSSATGPYICLQRNAAAPGLDAWLEQGRIGASEHSTLSGCLSAGGKVAIAASSTKLQAQLAGALMSSQLTGKRALCCGVAHGLGNDANWVTLPTDMEALMSASALAPEALIVGDVAGFDGALVLEALSSAPCGIALVTARSASAALSKLRRRALDPSLVTEAIDYIAVVADSDRGPAVVELISVGQAS